MITVTSSKLGSNCWASYRFTGHCHKCKRYDACTYSERVANLEYDTKRAKAAELKKQSEDLYREVREMEGRF